VSGVVDVTGDGRDEGVRAAAEALRRGELVVLPTDTHYGLAADAFSRIGTRRLFEARGGDRRVPLPVLLRSPKQLGGLVTTVPEPADRLMAAYWPGPLTMVVVADPNLLWDLGDNRGTVAVRMPLDDVTLAVIRAVGPVAVTAAARVGEPPAPDVAAAREQLGDAVRWYLDDGPRGSGPASTIVDLTRSVPQVLREGAVDGDEAVDVAAGRRKG
jgi:L-threonylcarbamoyladenylate synthase